MVEFVNRVQSCSHLARHPGGVVVNHIEGEVRMPVAQHLTLRFLRLLLLYVDSLCFFFFDILIDFRCSCNNAAPENVIVIMNIISVKIFSGSLTLLC